MAKQIIRFDDRQFTKLVMESVKETLRNRLNEDWDDDYGDDGLNDFGPHDFGDDEDSYISDWSRSQAKKKPKTKLQPKSSSTSKNVGEPSSNDGKATAFDFLNYLKQIRSEKTSMSNEDSSEEDIVTQTNKSENHGELYNSAMEAMETTNGTIPFEEWFEEFGGEVNRVEAKTAFDSAKKEYESYDEEDASEFSDREMNVSDNSTQNQEHKAGNVLEYDGVKITDDGRQFTMVAKENDPQITIKGSNLEEVENTYNRLWNNYSNMEQLARNIGYTVYHGAWLLAKDYDKFVRAAGAHEENLPVLIDLDKDKAEESWIERYKQPNGKYQMTTYQLSQLPDEQRKQWEKLSRSNPSKFSIYSKSANNLNK